MAAFNLKEHIDATVERVTVYDCEIAFRLRGAGDRRRMGRHQERGRPRSLTAFRYEDDIQNLRIWNSTVGNGMTRVFQAASSGSSGLDVRNLLVLGTLPAEAAGPSNLAVGSQAFVNAARRQLRAGAAATAIDAGVAIAAVTTDRNGVQRPQGAAYDVGAYESVGGAPNPPPVVTLTSPADGATFIAPATITLSANASDAEGSINEVGFYANGSLVGRDTTSPYTIVVTTVPAGAYTVTAVATDNLLATTTSAPAGSR